MTGLHGLAGLAASMLPQSATTDAIPAWIDSIRLAPLYSWLLDRPLVASLGALALLAGFAWLALAGVRRYLLRLIAAFIRRSPTFWDEVLLDREVFHRLAWAVPIVIVHQGLMLVPHLGEELLAFLQQLALASLALVGVRVFSALLSGVNDIYNRYPLARDRPIKGYLQVVSILAHLLAGIFIIAALMNKNPLVFLGGLGAMTAVLLLIFRDTLLSLVAGIQLTSNNLIRVGDWIEMPQFGADGDVVDIALNSVTVQNWDRTLTVIPTHKFLEHSFKNWRGMQQSGGRRIKRALRVDMSTIRFLDEEEIGQFSRFQLLRDYFAHKRADIEAYNRQQPAEEGLIPNARRLTNIGTLRAYIIQYLRQHPTIRKDMTFLVRQLEPSPEGLPLEVYVFSGDTAWANYEAIQADIFDHILAMVPQFGLRVYQKPTGAEIAAALGARELQTA